MFCSVGASSGASSAGTSAAKLITKWSVMCAPTAARSSTGSMPSARTRSAGPMPERQSRSGSWITPAARITSPGIDALAVVELDAGGATVVDDDAPHVRVAAHA